MVLLDELAADLRAGIYRPAPVRRVEIPKPDGRMRPLGKRARQRIKALTGRSRAGADLTVVIGELNLFLRGWGNYFRTGNAAKKFVQLDRHVVWRLKRLLVHKRGRNLRAGQADHWTPTWFHDQGLHQLMGTIRYPKAA